MRLIYALLVFLLVGCEAAEGGNTEKQTLVGGNCSKEYTLTSWNAGNFGKSKSAETLATMADILKGSDIVFLQEVSTGPAGAQTTGRLQSALDQTGARWDSLTSDATSGDGSERYSTLWKSSRAQVQRKNPLVADLADVIDREPHENEVTIEGIKIRVYNFHAVPTKKGPIREAKLVAESSTLAGVPDAFLVGDFNIGKVTIEGVLGSQGWIAHIDGKTSLKQKLGPSGEYLLYQYDHILSKGSTIKVTSSRVIDFVAERYSPITDESLRSARLVSDHLPVSIRFSVCRS